MSEEDKKPKPSSSERALLSERSKKFDPDATAEDCEKDLRSLQIINPDKFISRNFYRVHGKYSDATYGQFFGTFHEFRRKAGLELARDQHALERQIAKHASLDLYRKFYKSQVLPYHQKYSTQENKKGRWKTILIGSDFHDEDVDPFTLSVFIDTAHRLQPDIIVLNGDVFDEYEFSKFDHDPRQEDILEGFNFVKTHFFAPLRRACPNAQIDFIIGNHDWRIMKHLANQSPNIKIVLSDIMGLELKDVFGLDEFEINLTCKVDLAAFNVHDIKEQLKKNYKVFFNSFVCAHIKDYGFGLSGTSGHTHHPRQTTFWSEPMGNMTWTTTGSIARTNAEYVDGPDTAINSFLIAHVDTVTRSVAPEHLVIPCDSVVVHGKRYERKK